MIVKDLLDRCVPENVANIIATEQFDVAEEKRRRVVEVYTEMYQKLLKLTPTPTDHIIFGMRWLFKGKVDNSISLFLKKEIKEKFCPIPAFDIIEDVKKINQKEAEQILGSLSFPDTYSFLFTPWSEIVGYEVNEENIQEFGAENFLACLLFEITFFGFSEEDIQAEKIKVDKLLSEAMEQLKDAENEEDSIGEDENDFARSYLAKFKKDIVDERSEEEKEQELREMLFNAKAKYDTVKLLGN